MIILVTSDKGVWLVAKIVAEDSKRGKLPVDFA